MRAVRGSSTVLALALLAPALALTLSGCYDAERAGQTADELEIQQIEEAVNGR